VDLGRALRDARLGAGLSQQTVARRTGTSQAGLSRTERGRRSATLDDLAVLASAVGLDLVVRLFPGPDPVRDLAHVRLLARLQVELPGLEWSTEVPLPIPGDQRAIDAVVQVSGSRVGFELETRLVDAQSLVRRLALKQRDAGLTAMVLVLPDTRSNRTALAASAATLRAAFPRSTREVVAALRAGQAPLGNGILVV
jgi:transcriptional regulator with XRE-family HTH domain